MTAWAAGKFSGESVGTFINKCGIKDKVKHKSLVIPGYAAGISGELEEELAGWNVMVGPREASQIPKFLKTWKPARMVESARELCPGSAHDMSLPKVSDCH